MLCVLSAADEKDDMARAGSDTFAAIITQVDCLHELGIRNPPPPFAFAKPCVFLQFDVVILALDSLFPICIAFESQIRKTS